ncbi:MAG TPA: NAD(P)-dependent alcohol dehydrogenase [Micromonosporaceae bacterium]|nr:NAD(P)-dependent alcohol dehydrogenase [Micromonosporaceae bacterium]HCU49032.1 NAD(P)-dependent alcohol dehydrogenase [Micromonosporaceae bacterium]
MKAITQDRYGSPDVLVLKEINKPVAKDDEVLIRMRAAAVDAGTWHVMRGAPYIARLALGLRKPKSQLVGRDVAGTVEAVGQKVTRFRPGDEVWAEGDAGSFAEYLCVREKLVGLKPSNLTFEQAAAVPLSGNTALQGIRDQGQVKPGQRILINGASGGVGTFAVQIAKSLGAEVTGVCSTGKVDLVRSIGADHVVDYTKEDFTKSAQRYDVIFDLAGDHSTAECRRVLTPNGILVLSSGNGGRWLGPIGRMMGALALSSFTRQRLRPLVVARSKENLDALKELVESGKVTPVIDRAFPLSEAAEAIRYLEQGNARGKVVITVEPDRQA